MLRAAISASVTIGALRIIFFIEVTDDGESAVGGGAGYQLGSVQQASAALVELLATGTAPEPEVTLT
jgi:hypothetical protein